MAQLQRQNDNLMCESSFPTLFVIGSLVLLHARVAGWLESFLGLSYLPWVHWVADVFCHTWLSHGFWDSHACSASTLVTEPSSQT